MVAITADVIWADSLNSVLCAFQHHSTHIKINLGYVSCSMMTRSILATILWSVVAITADVIWAIAVNTDSLNSVLCLSTSFHSYQDKLRICVMLHDDSFDFSHNIVICGRHNC